MDRPIIYTQEQGRSTDFLFGMRSAMIGLAKLSSTVLGANTVARGLACTPNSPAAMNVLVGLGEVYAVAPVDGTAYGVLPADTTDNILKQGIALGTTTLSCPAPTTSGFSINYLIEAAYQDSDTTQVVLPYFNSANPSQPLNGPGGLGGSNATERQGIVVLQAKAGTAATTGTQTTPAPDSGYIGLWVVTVAFGASSITAGNISQYPGAPFVTNILQMLQTGSAIYAQDASVAANTISLALTPPVTSYTDGEPIRFKAANTNTGAVTINWGGGNVSLTGMNGALQGGEIVALKQYEAIYSSATGTAILIGQTAGALQVAPATQSNHAMQLGQATGRLINVQIFTGSGTYTPTSGMVTAIAEVQGGGGGTGGAPATGAGGYSGSPGGSSGSYAKVRFTAAQLGASQAVTIGAAGAAGASGSSNGGTGGTSSLGSLILCPGGLGSASYGPTTATVNIQNAPGAATAPTISSGTVIQSNQGTLGQGAVGTTSGGVLLPNGGTSPMDGSNTGPGRGGQGTQIGASQSAIAGNAGGTGKIVIWEYS